MKRNSLCLILIVIFSLVVIACNSNSASETIAILATAVPEPTVAPTIEPTAVPSTPEPTNTPESPEKPEVMVAFDMDNKELPEGVAMDNEGNIYVAVLPPVPSAIFGPAVLKLDVDVLETGRRFQQGVYGMRFNYAEVSD